MTISGTEALRQAHMTAHDYASCAVTNLCQILNIEIGSPKWREQLAPFACVLAAMVTAAAADFDTSSRVGVVEGVGPNHWNYQGPQEEDGKEAVGEGDRRW